MLVISPEQWVTPFIYFFSYFFFCARMTQMMICIGKKTTIHVPHCWNSYIVICLLALDSIIFCFRFSRLHEGGTSVNQSIRFDSRSKVVQDRTPGTLNHVFSCFLLMIFYYN